jgi:hypothetical protein
MWESFELKSGMAPRVLAEWRARRRAEDSDAAEEERRRRVDADDDVAEFGQSGLQRERERVRREGTAGAVGVAEQLVDNRKSGEWEEGGEG